MNLLVTIKSSQFIEKPIKLKMNLHSHKQSHKKTKESHAKPYIKALNFRASSVDIFSRNSIAPKRNIPIGNKIVVILNII